jgi:threonine dehydratase
MPAGELTLAHIRAAADRITGHVRRTPLLSAPALDALTGAQVHVKPECLQRSGSFKARGAFSRMSRLTPEERRAGVVAYSSGNHGAAVALAAHDLGVQAVVVVPQDAPAPKLAMIEICGAQIRRYDPEREQREPIAAAIAAERGLTMVPPFDDYDVMAGQGTVGLELAEQLPDVDLVLVPIGGGGLCAGTSTALKNLRPSARIVGVEPVGADDTRRSFVAGERVGVPGGVHTIAEGLRASLPGELTFPINAALLDDVVAVQEDDIYGAMRIGFEHLKVVIEPSGAVALAALTSGVVTAEPASRIAVVLSGGNVDLGRFAELVRPG